MTELPDGWYTDMKNTDHYDTYEDRILKYYGDVLSNELDSGDAIGWYVLITEFDGCGGAWDYTIHLYTVAKDKDGKVYIRYRSTHDDSCNGESESSEKIYNKFSWEVEQSHIKKRTGKFLPDFPTK